MVREGAAGVMIQGRAGLTSISALDFCKGSPIQTRCLPTVSKWGIHLCHNRPVGAGKHEHVDGGMGVLWI